MNYPKALYKGDFYDDWTDFCRDLELHKIQQIIVQDTEQETQWRMSGFTDAADLMQPPKLEGTITLPKKRGMPKGGWPKKVANGNPQ